ncbi:MAG TPA: hypothetical protein PLG79_00330 [Spirochaetales bacterium]|nr:hypothetical protein [Spirochaetales bacterium]
MNSRVRFTLTVCFSLLFLGYFQPAFLPGQETPFRWNGSVDWKSLIFTLRIEGSVPSSIVNPPTATAATEKAIEKALPQIFIEAASEIQIDSKRTLAEEFQKSDTIASNILLQAYSGNRGFPRYTSSLNSVTVEYSYPLYSTFSPLFIRHTQPIDIPRILHWTPTARFSGIVIYAKGELPVYGEHRMDRLKPALFPELFTETMDPVLLTSMGDPLHLRRWGVAAYSDSFDETPYLERIGNTPLRVFATGLFGKYPTDILLATEDAYKILSRPENRMLLAEGRILIITDQIRESFQLK